MGQADPAACGAMGAPELRAECEAFAAAELAMAGELDRAEAVCAGISAGTWRDECFFQLADTVSARGELGRHLCDEAGGFAHLCRTHAFSRQAEAVLATVDDVGEAACLAGVVDVAGRWFDAGDARTVAVGFVAAALSERVGAGPLSPAHCGDAPAALCVALYRDALLRPGGPHGAPTSGAIIGRVCQVGATAESVARAGLPSWEPTMQAPAAATWVALCGAGGTLKPRRDQR